MQNRNFILFYVPFSFFLCYIAQNDGETAKRGKKTLTDRENKDDTTGKEMREYPARPDPRLERLVRFLARRAAERDYAEMVEKSRRAPPPDGDKGRIR